MSLVDHLDDFRRRMVRCVALVCVAWVVAWFAHDPLYAILNSYALTGWPKNLKYTEAFLSVTDPFMLKLKLSFLFGLIVALPLVVVQLWGFISPGLKPHERRPFRIIGPLSVFLFALGCYFCWLIIPTTISWFASIAMQSYTTAQINQEPGRLVFFIVNMMLAFGAGFQLPLIVYFLAKVGILPQESLSQYWRQAVVIVFVVSAVLTPSNDPISMLMMAIPLCILFMLSVWAVRITDKRDAAREEARYRFVASEEKEDEALRRDAKGADGSIPFSPAVEDDAPEPSSKP